MTGFILSSCLICTSLADTDLKRYESEQAQLGTIIKITVYADDEALARKAMRSAFNRIEKLNLVLSDYDSNSELRRLCNQAIPGEPVHVSADLFKVLHRAEQISRQTDGAFDVTVGPVVKMWRRARRRKRLPDAMRLQAALAKVGYQNVGLNRCARTVELKKTNMLLDLGGIAKGYIADQALKELQRHGIKRALIDAGGDIVAGDAPPGQPGWRIGIEQRDDQARLSLLLSLKNAAVATSGDTYQFVQIDGVRYSHIVDPRTGMGLTTPRSVTVIAPDGMAADAWASAISVLGPEQGLKIVNQQKSLAVSISQLDKKNQVHRYHTKRIMQFVIKDNKQHTEP